LRLLAFHDLDFSLDPYRSGYQLSSTLATLWKLLVQRDKQRIQQTIQGLLIRTRDILRDIVKTQLFRDTYEPQLRQLMIEAAQRTLKRPRVAQAQEVAMDSLLQALSDRVLPLLPRIVPKVSAEILSNALPNLTFFLRTGSVDPEVLGQALSTAWSDPQVRRAIDAAFAGFIRSAEGTAFVKETLAAFATEFSADPRLPLLLEAIASEPAIVTHVQPLGEAVAQSVREIATVAFSTDGGARLEPFAAMVLKALIFKQRHAFILLTTDRLFERLSPLSFPAFKRVVNLGAAS
jgi:hypothetical protein